MNTKPPAVAIGPAKAPDRPVFCFAGGSPSVIPSGTCHAISPVFAFTANKRYQGGFTHGRLPMEFPAASFAGAVKFMNPAFLS